MQTKNSVIAAVSGSILPDEPEKHDHIMVEITEQVLEQQAEELPQKLSRKLFRRLRKAINMIDRDTKIAIDSRPIGDEVESAKTCDTMRVCLREIEKKWLATQS